MLDLNRVQRDLESPAYGALSHATEVLARTVRAGLAVALCSDVSHRIETVYVICRHDQVDASLYHQLRRWPSDTCSKLWQAWQCDRSSGARLLDPAAPADAPACREIAQTLGLPVAQRQPHALLLSLGDQPLVRALLLRSANQPPFEPPDPQRVMRFAAQSSHVIEQGHRRELHRRGVNSDTLKLTPNHSDTHELLNHLSSTEHRVLHHLRKNLTERQVAQAMGRSHNTVHVHVKSIYRKLRVNNRGQLLRLLNQLAAEINQDDPPQRHAMFA